MSFIRPAIYLSTSRAGTYPICGTIVRSTARFVSYRWTPRCTPRIMPCGSMDLNLQQLQLVLCILDL